MWTFLDDDVALVSLLLDIVVSVLTVMSRL